MHVFFFQWNNFVLFENRIEFFVFSVFKIQRSKFNENIKRKQNCNKYHFQFISVEKLKKRYGHLGNIVRQKVSRNNESMGLALAGHRDRNEMGCFIAGVNPKGTTNLQQFNIGDELLEVYTLFLLNAFSL